MVLLPRHPRNCSHRFTRARGFKPRPRKVPSSRSPPQREKRERASSGKCWCEGGRECTWLAPRTQSGALGSRSTPPSRLCEAFPARFSPLPGLRTTCCSLGALRPSLGSSLPVAPVRGGWNTRFNPNYPESTSPPLPRGRILWNPGAS